MKKTRSVIVTTLIALLGFGAAVYTSCNKDRCSNVTCQNGGTCLNGYCTCPVGFEGDHCEIGITSTVEYRNHGYTDIMLTLNNIAYTVPAGRSKGFMGAHGDSLKGNAYTAGGHGVAIRWDSVFNTYPENGTTVVDLNIPAEYFYLYLTNADAADSIRYINVDENSVYGYQGVVDLYPNFLHNGVTIGLGYFHAYDSSEVYVKSPAPGGGQWWFKKLDGTLVLPMTENQAATVVTH